MHSTAATIMCSFGVWFFHLSQQLAAAAYLSDKLFLTSCISNSDIYDNSAIEEYIKCLRKCIQSTNLSSKKLFSRSMILAMTKGGTDSLPQCGFRSVLV